MAEVADRILKLLQDKDYRSLLDQLVLDNKLLSAILKSKAQDIVNEVVPFILNVCNLTPIILLTDYAGK